MATPKRNHPTQSGVGAAVLPLAATCWHTVDDVAKRYHRKPETIRDWLRSGYLPGSIIGGRWLISDAQLAAFEDAK